MRVPGQDSARFQKPPPRRLFLLSLTSVLNSSLSLSKTLHNRVSLRSVLYSSSPSELDRKSSPPEDDGALELLSNLRCLDKGGGATFAASAPGTPWLLAPPPQMAPQESKPVNTRVTNPPSHTHNREVNTNNYSAACDTNSSARVWALKHLNR